MSAGTKFDCKISWSVKSHHNYNCIFQHNGIFHAIADIIIKCLLLCSVFFFRPTTVMTWGACWRFFFRRRFESVQTDSVHCLTAMYNIIFTCTTIQKFGSARNSIALLSSEVCYCPSNARKHVRYVSGTAHLCMFLPLVYSVVSRSAS